MRTFILLSFLIFYAFSLNAQTAVNKRFEGKIIGADVALVLLDDSTYYLQTVRFWCSLCDMDAMAEGVYQKGGWNINDNRIALNSEQVDSTLFFLILNETNVRPLFAVDRRTYNIDNDTIKEEILNNTIGNELYDFLLVTTDNQNPQ